MTRLPSSCFSISRSSAFSVTAAAWLGRREPWRELPREGPRDRSPSAAASSAADK